jgi:hypothetical protein
LTKPLLEELTVLGGYIWAKSEPVGGREAGPELARTATRDARRMPLETLSGNSFGDWGPDS